MRVEDARACASAKNVELCEPMQMVTIASRSKHNESVSR